MFQQTIYSIYQALLKVAHGRNRWLSFAAKAGMKCLPRPVGVVKTILFGKKIEISANHHLPSIIQSNPLWSKPLVHAVMSLPHVCPIIVDVGANIGDTVLLIEHYLPQKCQFICVEPDDLFHDLCKKNLSGVTNVELHKRFIACKGKKLSLSHGAPGTATSQIDPTGESAVTLDEIIADRSIHLIKIDTDGMDFEIVRSAAASLRRQRPALFFEWDAKMWQDHGEDPADIFPFLIEHGYRHFELFTDGGFSYCSLAMPCQATIQGLVQAALSRRGIDNLYFDVLAADEALCHATADRVCKETQEVASKCAPWKRMQPMFWC